MLKIPHICNLCLSAGDKFNEDGLCPKCQKAGEKSSRITKKGKGLCLKDFQALVEISYRLVD